MIKNSILIM